MIKNYQAKKYTTSFKVIYKITLTCTSFFWSGLRGSKAYSLWGGVIPSPSIGYDYL